MALNMKGIGKEIRFHHVEIQSIATKTVRTGLQVF